MDGEGRGARKEEEMEKGKDRISLYCNPGSATDANGQQKQQVF